MEKNFDFVNNGYTGEGVIVRGYAIYDEWNADRRSSRKIVRCVARAISTARTASAKSAFVEALACLFALDMRITERYNTLLRCLFLYFSWRRETGALKRLKFSLHIEEGVDVRTAIELELEKLRENLEAEEADDADDETHGGKRNGKAEEEVVATEEKGKEQVSKEKAEEIADAKEEKDISEEKAEDVSEQTPTDGPIKDSGEKQQSAEIAQEAPVIAAQDETEQPRQEERSELKEENNGSFEKAEPSKDKPKEARTYNDAVDSPPLYEERVSNKKATEAMSFIDEVIMDNMVKGDKNVIGYNPMDGLKQGKEAERPQDTVAHQNKENKSTDKDAYLYDKTLANDKGNTQQNDKVETKQEPQKVEAKEQKESMQTSDNVKSTIQEFKSLSETLHADINADRENNVANELNNTMSTESKLAYIRMQEDMFREQMSIAMEELGIDDHAEIIGISEPTQISQPSVGPNRK